LEIRDHRILLTQEFHEAAFYDSSAVAIAIVGRDATADFANEQTVRLLVAPGRGKFTILIASAASFDQKADVADLALREIDSVNEKSFDELLTATRNWWREY